MHLIRICHPVPSYAKLCRIVCPNFWAHWNCSWGVTAMHDKRDGVRQGYFPTWFRFRFRFRFIFSIHEQVWDGGGWQVIDVENCTLNNVITFPPTGSFVVDSTIEVVSKQRVNFRLESWKSIHLFSFYLCHVRLFLTLLSLWASFIVWTVTCKD